MFIGARQQLRAVNVDSPFHRLRVEFLSGESLDEHHQLATARAPPYSLRTGFGLHGIGTAQRSHSQQLLAERQQRLAAAVCQEAEEADAYKAMWKHMEKKAAQKLLCCHCHQFLFAAVGVILPAESDLTIGEVDEPMVGNRDAMCVAGQIMKDVLRTAERRLGVHDPVLAE